MPVERLGVHASVDAVFPKELFIEALDEVAPEIVVVGEDHDDPASCDAVVTFTYDESLLETDWIHSIQAGVDRFPFDTLRDEGVALTNSTGIHGTAIGETVAGYMLSFARRLHIYRDQQDDHVWERPDYDVPFTLDDNSLCVVGLGTLGQGIARRGDALGMDVVGVRRSGEAVPGVRRVYTPDDLHEAIGDAKFVALATPLTAETRGLIGADELGAMREDAYLINVARGPVVDQDALVEVLQEDALAGAALDVFETEPLPDDSPLWDFEEVIVTPHTGGQKRTYHADVADLVRENIDRVQRGVEMVNRVV